MNKDITALFFSPTGSTKKIVKTILEPFDEVITTYDLTKPVNRLEPIELEGQLIILGVPVYEDRIPEVLHDFFLKITAKDCIGVVVASFGNIGYGNILNELRATMDQIGIPVIAAAAFVGEHSFSTKEYQIAADRPNASDLKEAYTFGQAIKEKYTHKNIKDCMIPKGPFSLMGTVLPKNSIDFFVRPPRLDINTCTNCGICAAVCPVKAIDPQSLEVDEQRCIRCCSCVKNCAQNARMIDFKTPLMHKILTRIGKKPKQNQIYY